MEKKQVSEINIETQKNIKNKSIASKNIKTKHPRKPAKKKRLPNDFQKLLEEGDLNKLKEVFEICDINARSKYLKNTALMSIPMPDLLFTWLIEQGADMFALNDYEETLLHVRAISYQSLDGLFDLGLNVNQQDKTGNTPLHSAASSLKGDNLILLIKHGADIHIKNNEGQTALDVALLYCCNYHLEDEIVKIVTYLISAGAIITEKMRERVTAIGENFEFHRLGYNAETVDAASTGLNKLYKIFQIEPIPHRIIHDGKSLIIVKTTEWEDQHKELWQLLVPSSGPSQTVQGEVIRIAGRIDNELEGNGGINWNIDFKKMADCFFKHVQTGHPLADNILIETKELIAEIKKKKGNTE